ncbi:MAG: hypothetical protein R3Y58_07340 [Eubacteriales bacterium]
MGKVLMAIGILLVIGAAGLSDADIISITEIGIRTGVGTGLTYIGYRLEKRWQID